MRQILNFLINPRVIKAIAFLVLITILIFFPIILWLKVLLIAIVLILWLLIHLAEKQQAAKSGKSIEQALWNQADEQAINVKPDRKAEIEEIKQKFQNAVLALKSTKLGKGTLGNSALYALPWFMIIGPPRAGKTTAIKEAGLNLLDVDPSGEKQSVKGIGGTRNCEWWFAGETILLDTAGRWTIEEEDKDEWLNFLKFLRKYRRKKPINGVMVAVSVEELMNFSENQIEAQAQSIRNRIDELIKELGIIFPIYVVFTKCDLISGFIEMFGDMSKAQRSQVWGHTVSLEELKSFQPTAIFENGIRDLRQALNSYRLTKLRAESKEDRRNTIFLFPVQFSTLQNKLSQFMGRLFKKNPYQEQPLFRGFYFTSGTQEGNPIDIIAENIRRELNVPISPRIFEEPAEKKSYFLTDLFTRVMIPDQKLAGLTGGEKIKRKFFTYGVFAVVTVLLGLFILAETTSFGLNKNYLNEIQDAAEAVNKIQSDKNQPDEIKENLDRLDGLRKILDRPTPIMSTFGLNVSNNVNPLARELYFSKAKNIILNPVEMNIYHLKEMSRLEIQEDYQFYYDTFHSYLMLTGYDDIKPNQELLARHLVKLNQGMGDAKVDMLVEQQVQFYLKHLKDKNTPRLETTPETVEDIRQKLIEAQLIGPAGYYARIRSDAAKISDRFPDFDLSDALQDPSQEVLKNGYIILGLYTRDGWNNFVHDEIYKKDVQKEDPVLGTKAEELNKESIQQLRSEVASLYFDDYRKHWIAFLSSTQIVPFSDLYDAKQKLEVLSNSEESPLYLLLKSVYENTRLEKIKQEDQRLKQAQKKAGKSKIGKKVQQAQKYLADKEDAAAVHTDALAKNFGTIHKLMGDLDQGQLGPIKEYIKSLGEIYGKIEELEGAAQKEQDAADLTKKVFKDDNELTRTLKFVTSNTIGSNELRNLLEQPVHQSWRVILNQAQKYLDEEWKIGVWEKFNEFSRNFPFNANSKEEAPIQDVATFFGPQGTFWIFYDKELKNFIEPDRSGRWTAKSPSGGLQDMINFSSSCIQAFQQADKIKQSMFSDGSIGFEFDIRPEPYTMRRGANPNIKLIILSFDGNELKYDNSQAEWREYKWPGNGGAKLEVKTMNARNMPETEFNYDGHWALFRLLEAGRQTGRQRSNLTYSWEFYRQGEGQYLVNIVFQFRSKTNDNPFEKGLFSQFRCPAKIGEDSAN